MQSLLACTARFVVNMGVFSTIFWILFLVNTTLCTTKVSNGASGPACGSDGLSCLDGEATCVQGSQCVCNDRSDFGDGRMNCYRNHEFRTEVTSGPMVLTYSNETIRLPLPCQYLLTHIVTDRIDSDGNGLGSCDTRVYPSQKKDNGKFFVAGYDVIIVLPEHTAKEEMALQIRGVGLDGEYEFDVVVRNGSITAGASKDGVTSFDSKVTGLSIECRLDVINNILQIEIKECGVRIRFRPFDQIKRRTQSQKPGIGVAVNSNFKPRFQSLDKTVSLPPLEGYDIESVALPGLGRIETLVYRAFISMFNRAQSNPSCVRSAFIFSQCQGQRKQAALQMCLWMLMSPRFIKCYDRTVTGDTIMALFNKCSEISCGCLDIADVISLITNARCHTVTGYPELNEFLDTTSSPCPSPSLSATSLRTLR